MARSRSPDHRSSSSRRREESPSGGGAGGSRYERSNYSSSSRRPDERRSGGTGRYDDHDRRDRDRDRDRRDDHRRDDRDRDRDRDRHSDRDRDRDRDRRRHDDTRRRTPSPPRDRERERDRDRDRDRARKTSIPPRETDHRSPGRSPAPAAAGSTTEEEKQKIKREKLEAWKKQREKQKLADGKASTPTPTESAPAVPTASEKKPVIAQSTSGMKPIAATTAKPGSSLPPKPIGGFNFGGFAGVGLPMNAGSKLKRSVVALEHDEEGEPERKLEKLDLPEVDPTIQTGAAAEQVDVIGDDLAAEDVDGTEDQKPDIIGDGDIKMDEPDAKPKVEEAKVEEEEEEDPLDAYMKEIGQDVSEVNRGDAKRLGMMAADEEDEDKEIQNVAEKKLQEAEALLAIAASRSRKKDLPPPDHSKIKYEPFRKAFYSAPIEVMEMDEEETELLRLEMDGIKVRGQDVPRPVKNWGAFGLPTGCLDLIQRRGWTQPTSIQAQSIPCIMSGRDVIGIAKTGSGKTIAYLLPLFRHVKDQRPATGMEGPIAMVMAPTRELAMQIYSEIKGFVKALNFRVACCVGGVSISEDISEMKKGADIVICTPGRMIDLLTANNGRVTNVRRVTYLVLDEADRMFDMGFEPQVMKIVSNIRPDCQKVLFSATFPKTMESLARRILQRPLEITVGGRSVVAPEIDQRVEIRDSDTKFTRLLQLLGEYHQANKEEEDDFRTLIFVERQDAADDLFRELLTRGYVCASLHGGKEQVDRDEAITNFKRGDVPTIVATSVAARGLDVKELKLVINYDAPNHMEDYVHRAGRTGRAGNKGTCITFVSPDQEKLAVDIVRALEASGAFIPDELKNMSDGFLEKIKSGKAKASGGGFKGKGLERFDKKREEKDRAEVATYGDTSEALSLSSREGAVIPYKPKTNEYKPPDTAHNRGEADYTFTEIKVEIVKGPAPDKALNPALYGTSSGKNAMASLPQQTLDALKKARAEGRNVDAANLQKVISRLTQAIDLGMKNQSAAAMPPPVASSFGTSSKPKDPDATDYHAIFPINDYPQKARWKATNKEQMTLLSEISGASITMRGVYYPPGEDPPMAGEPKLHLLIESNDEMKVRAAVEEIRRNLVEASVLALNNADRGGAAGGRYSV